MDAAGSLLELFRGCVNRYGWSLREIEETNLETLIDFFLQKDKNTLIIDGKVYKRANEPPAWL